MTEMTQEWEGVGARVRAARKREGISVRELARRIGVSASHVSQVERGLGSFSAAVLYAVASELHVSLDTLFADVGRPAAPVEPDAAAPIDVAFEGGIVLREADRPHMTLRDGPRWDRLTSTAEADSEFLEVHYYPSDVDPDEIEFVRHRGREYGVVVAGRLNIQIGFDRTVLETGDSISFDSMTPHRYWNDGDEECRAIWFVREGGTREASSAHVGVTLDSPRQRS